MLRAGSADRRNDLDVSQEIAPSLTGRFAAKLPAAADRTFFAATHKSTPCNA